ncbi:DUF4124 domain-containing protein [Arenimonas oryziterrae]|uniref:DUF4124 domain-containing protein n=1 Tax=Arenimonas oryziterrae DSM 21050 = YC6267 TaxID=1121015 RepID=A0A091BGZ4_9GAMM|nr:DUF4124 domain-containing protein [Arenimonas oryziterrae]KFN43645.1 hypothetical protein N789_10235 [Arenimonas oryziterrae DSM 21050 = YC6267]
MNAASRAAVGGAITLIAFASLLPPRSEAAPGALYKCTDANGVTSIQSDRCPKGSVQVWKRESVPDPQPTPEQLQQAEARRAKESADARSLSIMAGTTRETPPPAPPPPPVVVAPVVPEGPPKGPCRTAHELEQSIRDKPWLEMRDDQLRRLNDWVVKQCTDVSGQH